MRLTSSTQYYLGRVLNTGGELPGLSLPNGRERKPGRDTKSLDAAFALPFKAMMYQPDVLYTFSFS